MMNIRQVKISMPLLLFLLLVANPQYVQADEMESKPIYISGKIDGDTEYVTSIRFIIVNEYDFDLSKQLDTTVAILDNAFTIELPAISKTFKLTAMCLNYKKVDDRNGELEHDLLFDYVIEPNDSVFMNIQVKYDSGYFTNIEGVNFSGRGSLKYQARWQLEKYYNTINYLQLQNQTEIGDRGERESGTNTLREWYWDSNNLPEIVGYYKVSKSLLTAKLLPYRNVLPSQVYQVMLADVIGKSQYDMHHLLGTFYYKGDLMRSPSDTLETFQPHVQRTRDFYYNFFYKDSLEYDFPYDVICLSPYYTDYLFQREVTKLIYDNEIVYPSWPLPPFEQIYSALKERYSGDLRERLITLSINDVRKKHMFNKVSKDSVPYYIEDALKIVSDAVFRNAIMNSTVARTMPGAVPYDFGLPDTSGNIVRLSDFKGEVVLMDMWFTGCTGCILFTEKLNNKIFPKLSKKPIIISICTDAERNMWVRSLKSGKYSNPNHVNLFMKTEAGKRSFKNYPLTSYYGIQSMPFLLLIDKKGRIVCQLSLDDSDEAMIRKIQEAIDERT